MATLPKNRAAWTFTSKAVPYVVEEAPYSHPSANEIVIKNGACAINPLDWKMQKQAIFPTTYPTILGTDIAGEIVEVGSEIADLKVGDGVFAWAPAIFTGQHKHGAFQEYSVVTRDLTVPYPKTMSVENAAVLPLAICTAIMGLYPKEFLDLPEPSLEPKSTGKTLLLWGASSSVGIMTVQMAVASGVEVIATASKRNHEMVKMAGAAEVFDQNEAGFEEKLIAALKGKTMVGAYDAISLEETKQACGRVLAKTEGAKFLTLTLGPGVDTDIGGGVTAKRCMAYEIRDHKASQKIWQDWVPKALELGKLKPMPEPLIVGKGLEKCQEACDLNKKGISGKKVMFTL